MLCPELVLLCPSSMGLTLSQAQGTPPLNKAFNIRHNNSCQLRFCFLLGPGLCSRKIFQVEFELWGQPILTSYWVTSENFLNYSEPPFFISSISLSEPVGPTSSSYCNYKNSYWGNIYWYFLHFRHFLTFNYYP